MNGLKRVEAGTIPSRQAISFRDKMNVSPSVKARLNALQVLAEHMASFLEHVVP